MLKKSIRPLLLMLLLGSTLFSCRTYKQDIMFKTDEELNVEAFRAEAAEAERNYKIRVNDRLNFRVATNKGERLVDPDMQYRMQFMLEGGGVGRMQQQQQVEPSYYVNHEGMVKLPMVGYVKLEGLTRYQADSVLRIRFAEHYNEPFVVTIIENRRAIVLGAIGGIVVPLENENMTLIEVLALAGGVTQNARVSNIKLIRGDLSNPSVQIINLSTIAGLREAEVLIQPNDIIYIEPVYRVVTQAVRDFSPILSVFSSILAIVVLISR